MKAERALTLGVWKDLSKGRKGLNFGSMEGRKGLSKGPLFQFEVYRYCLITGSGKGLCGPDDLTSGCFKDHKEEHLLIQGPCGQEEHLLIQGRCGQEEHLLIQGRCGQEGHLLIQGPCEQEEHLLIQGPCGQEAHLLIQGRCGQDIDRTIGFGMIEDFLDLPIFKDRNKPNAKIPNSHTNTQQVSPPSQNCISYEIIIMQRKILTSIIGLCDRNICLL